MLWTVRIGTEDVVIVKVSDVCLHALQARIRDSELGQMDPYRDTIFDRRLLLHWQAEFAQIAAELRAEAAARLAETRHLPRESPARELVLQDWVDRELASDRSFQELREMVAAVELALEGGGVIVALGD